MTAETPHTFTSVHERLNQIVDEVSSEDITLDEALKLYEEAVKLGLSACDLSEQDIEEHLATEAEAAAEAETGTAGEAAAQDAAAGEGEVAADAIAAGTAADADPTAPAAPEGASDVPAASPSDSENASA